MSLTNSVLMGALREWVQKSSTYAGGQSLAMADIRRAHNNGPPGQSTYVIIQPLFRFRRVNIQPLIHKQGGKRYRINTWEIISEISAYRGEPEELLALCKEGLIDSNIRRAAFLDRGITVHGSSDVEGSPQVKNNEWERQAKFQVKLRYSPAIESEMDTLKGVLITFQFNGLTPETPKLITP